MLSIHHQYFLHVVDAIFKHASSVPPSLAIMAQTCREWRRRSLSPFHTIRGYQILEEHPKPTVVVWDQFDNVLFFRGRSQLALLADCHVLDIRDISHAKPEPATFLPNLKTVRYQAHLDPERVTSRTEPFGAKQIVCQNHVYSFDCPSPAVNTVVIHCAEPHANLRIWGADLVSEGRVNLSGLSELTRLIIIFEKPLHDAIHDGKSIINIVIAKDSTLSRKGWHSKGEPCKQLRLIRRLMQAAVHVGAAVVLVGTEAFSDDDVAEIHRFDFEGRIHAGADEPKGWYSFVTLDAYRRDVGEEEWAIQTCWDGPLFPHRTGA
ncbi:hypothetical protein A1Q1_07403 [Trichosporon asahii var. asahii CBS 2479]|uniref:F-box domain-containing protein n=1 Tax=Trichosporon asahii var. asahii (strain ATCC 90039 / CBS 2479 / JCM 2466 / KCTC 7840 / NBRC 103889/ NCYC 2677 / UAMH 7654) TaxID=1186058 RepID=J5TL17_TRIAS|nr:hypothetical protein A1Q1_07403 [Trichosporon asahii var. asahii CBS 2479]EJT51431.1 hypothetical protein A1Q1_07403 [Trichosporon asahii var. asahii CBS 2479]